MTETEIPKGKGIFKEKALLGTAHEFGNMTPEERKSIKGKPPNDTNVLKLRDNARKKSEETRE